MSVSLEALAMAGIDSNEWGMDAQEWERNEIDVVPPHLLADEEDDEDGEYVTSTISNYCFRVDGSFGGWRRRDWKADGAHRILGIFYSLSKVIEKRASNGMNSVRIIVRTILGFLMVMTNEDN
ncbi:Tetratricopeptide-like helical [Cucumis melo var. makuwa]|uniref:Tetratricopeptide-like helical n=2 Tax=Cucumis melo TaxID=3656 RepID=A0A5A7TS68_CUCMM|nr:uncharacterized protein LOC127150187 [Cucumis melo]KAA0044707.1 Tetratricopeptide-like helical [Cucumis melo var. makuwa]